MRVGILTTSFPRYDGDFVGVFVYDLVKALAAEGIDIKVLTPHTKGTELSEIIDRIQINRFRYFLPTKYQRLAYSAGIPTNLSRSWLAKIQMFPFFLAFTVSSLKYLSDCDIIHAHWIETGLIGLLLRRMTGSPLVISVHRYNPIGPLGRYPYHQVLNHVDYVLFNSSFTYRRAQNSVGFTSGSVIPPGVDTIKFYPKWEDLNTEFDYDKSKFTILTVGSLIPRKGFIHLIDAIPEIITNFDCQFVIGGDGPERNRLLEHAADLGVSHQVSLLGQVSTSDMPKLMRQADIFVLPSIPTDSGENEPLGMVLVEALASGTPCVASRTGGIIDIIENGVDGLLVQPGNSIEIASAIQKLMKEPEIRIKMGMAGRKKVVDKYSLNYVSRRLIEIYNQILDH